MDKHQHNVKMFSEHVAEYVGRFMDLNLYSDTFDEFAGNEILSDRDVQDYHSAYIDIYNEFRKGKEEEKEKAKVADFVREAGRLGVDVVGLAVSGECFAASADL